jgi:CDP-glycerol glycerophosphotransferase (TagB/SpsB family)
MINLANKYKDNIQIAFKPHPLLLTKLYKVWGKKKTDDYYAQWVNGENTQLVLGDYVSLFMLSDALVHDCSSFTVEYHYTRKPVMYLTKDEHHADGLNDFGKMAFDLHYKGSCEEDIEAFINDVIEGRDEMKEKRKKFYNDYLLPPNGNSASENIIKAILGNSFSLSK